MKVFLISDPHLGRDMSRFGEVWVDHETRIAEHWRVRIGPDDVVLIPGDISWATTTKAIKRHMDFLEDLPGRVILSPGNHDRWWRKTAKLDYPSLTFLEDGHLPFGEGRMLAATMGWDSPESPWWNEQAMRADFEVSVSKLDTTLAAAAADCAPGDSILLMIHYPPRWAREQTPTAFEEVIARYPVDLVVYGHIHGVDLVHAYDEVMDVGGRPVRYLNGSCDQVRCTPVLVGDLAALPALSLSG